MITIIIRGGCGIVWMAIDKNNKEYAIKQIVKKCKISNTQLTLAHNAQIAKREIDMLNYLSSLPNTSDIMVSYKGYHENTNDIWIIFEKGGYSLSNLTFKIKGEFLNSERVYAIKKGYFLKDLMTNLNQFKHLIKSILSFIHFISKLGIVHSDIKPENILISYNKESFLIEKIKVIDFGSAFFISNPLNFSSNTPEYMSPEITSLLEKSASSKEIIKFLWTLADYPSCIDIWSLGVSLLELVLACPLWMSYKAKVIIRNRTIYKTGLFGVKGREGNKIFSKQAEVSQNVHGLLEDCLIEDPEQRNMFGDLIKAMIEIDYTKRIKPCEALKHPFLN